MANAARVHAVDAARRFRLHHGRFWRCSPCSARLAEKLGMHRVVVPPGAGVGSAIGFFRHRLPFGWSAACGWYSMR
ncbi:MAG: hypothetical protein Ct9H300mP16_13780 [Pseudomonadota bacterium]|nr:MAG: hypothetical protein Ct9H300mP16_13780 [Pseudomonadota bacterium]